MDLYKFKIKKFTMGWAVYVSSGACRSQKRASTPPQLEVQVVLTPEGSSVRAGPTPNPEPSLQPPERIFRLNQEEGFSRSKSFSESLCWGEGSQCRLHDSTGTAGLRLPWLDTKTVYAVQVVLKSGILQSFECWYHSKNNCIRK